jgi:serine/threonine-protein kinase
MAPERIGTPESVDPRADVYGVGALVYFLVAGKPPFDGETEADILRDVLTVEAPRLAAALPGVPPALDEIVARCLAKKPEMRPEAIGEIAAVLTSLDVQAWTREDASAWWDAREAR